MSVKPPAPGVGEAFGTLFSAIGSSFSSPQPVAQSAPSVEQADQAPKPVENIEFPSEVQRIYYQFVDDMAFFTAKYPLLSVASSVTLAFFGLFNVLSLSPTNIITGVFLFTLCVAIVKNMAREGFGSYVTRLPGAIFSVGSFVKMNQKADEAAPVAQAPAAPKSKAASAPSSPVLSPVQQQA